MLEDVSKFPQLVITQQRPAACNYDFWKHHKQALFTDMDGSKLHYREIWDRANTRTRSKCLIRGEPALTSQISDNTYVMHMEAIGSSVRNYCEDIDVLRNHSACTSIGLDSQPASTRNPR